MKLAMVGDTRQNIPKAYKLRKLDLLQKKATTIRYISQRMPRCQVKKFNLCLHPRRGDLEA